MRRAGLILIAVLGVLALMIDFVPGLSVPDISGQGGNRPIETKLGLDLRGGLKVEYRVNPTGDRTPTTADVEIVKGIIEKRVNATGVSEPLVVTSGTDRIVVEIPGVSDPTAIRKLVGQTGQLFFVPIPSTMKPPAEGDLLQIGTNGLNPLFGGTEVASATVGTDRNGARTVNFTLKENGRNLFAQWTAAHVNQYFAIVLDSRVISAPVINEAIPGGDVQISAGGLGGFAKADADNLVNVLRFGSLPFPVQELSSDTIDPTLGQEFLTRSLLAGAIAIFLVLFFMLLHYRLPGLVAGLALTYYAILVYAIFRLIPVTLTLAGIAGFVLSIGMAVDANILIFERSKEEIGRAHV